MCWRTGGPNTPRRALRPKDHTPQLPPRRAPATPRATLPATGSSDGDTDMLAYLDATDRHGQDHQGTQKLRVTRPSPLPPGHRPIEHQAPHEGFIQGFRPACARARGASTRARAAPLCLTPRLAAPRTPLPQKRCNYRSTRLFSWPEGVSVLLKRVVE